MDGCQNYSPFLDPYYNAAPNIQGTQKGTIILTTTQIRGRSILWQYYIGVLVSAGLAGHYYGEGIHVTGPEGWEREPGCLCSACSLSIVPLK